MHILSHRGYRFGLDAREENGYCNPCLLRPTTAYIYTCCQLFFQSSVKGSSKLFTWQTFPRNDASSFGPNMHRASEVLLYLQGLFLLWLPALSGHIFYAPLSHCPHHVVDSISKLVSTSQVRALRSRDHWRRAGRCSGPFEVEPPARRDQRVARLH